MALGLLLRKLEAVQPFSEAEAWWLFRTAAISEAVGWTLLITGILIRHYNLPGRNIAVPIAGQIHGTIFLVYFGILIAVYSSLHWSRKKFVVSAIAGVPPYGTLVFEQWAAWVRHNERCRILFRSTLFTNIINKKFTSPS